MSQCRPVIGFSSQGEMTSVKLASYSTSDSDFSQNTFKRQVWDAEYEYDLCFYVQLAIGNGAGGVAEPRSHASVRVVVVAVVGTLLQTCSPKLFA